MLPNRFRAELLEQMSLKTMRYVESVPIRSASGLVRRVYDMIAEDFFINGSLTSHSRVPELLAGVWTGGRETILVSDRLERSTKYTITATLSRFNDCPYCGDMLISLVHGSGGHEAAAQIFAETEERVADPTLRQRLAWIGAVATAGPEGPPPAPFTSDEMPEAIGALLAMSHINRFSHVVMDGSPVAAPFGLSGVKSAALKVFGHELKSTTEQYTEPGRALDLLPPAPMPEDMRWAVPNPRIADALSRWVGAIDRQTALAVPPAVRELVELDLRGWTGERMPLSRGWVDDAIGNLQGMDRAVARLTLVVAKASYQVDDGLVEAVLGEERDQERLVRVLAWASFSAARRIAERAASAVTRSSGSIRDAA